MSFSLYSTRADAPPPFVYKPALTTKDVRGGAFALLTDDMAPFMGQFGHLLNRVAGLVLTPGSAFAMLPLADAVWQLTFPPSFVANLPAITHSYLTLISGLRVEQNENKRQSIELERTQTDLKRLTDYAELIQAKLRSDLQQYSEWTVKALTELLKFEALQAKQTPIELLPERIVHFLIGNTFDYTGAAMLAETGAGDWEQIAQVGQWDDPIDLEDTGHFQDDVWHVGSHMYAPLAVNDARYVVIVTKGIPQASFSEYEFTFFQMLSTLMAATYEAKLLESERQHELAERTRAEEALARALRAKDEFLASVSHELRTPLNAVLGQTQLMQEGIHGPLLAKQEQALTIISESSLHLLSLIEDILDLAKIEAMATRLDMTVVEITAVCQSSLRMVREMAQRKQIKVLSTIDHDLAFIQADERRLKQILINLLSNAIKFTDAGGRVGLEVVEDPAAGMVNFSVWDTGIGIAREDINRLFEPFVQVDSSLARQYEGTGLGLALVDRLTEMHEGRIVVDSQLGVGSRFTIALPHNMAGVALPTAIPAPVEEKMEPTISATNGRSAHILLAEDNATNVTTMIDILEFMDYRVTVATNGQEAVTSAQKELPDIILMDMQMPVMDGLEATRRLRANPLTATIPIIALTGMALSDDRERSMQAGCTDYLTKPIRIKDLREKLAQFLG